MTVAQLIERLNDTEPAASVVFDTLVDVVEVEQYADVTNVNVLPDGRVLLD